MSASLAAVLVTAALTVSPVQHHAASLGASDYCGLGTHYDNSHLRSRFLEHWDDPAVKVLGVTIRPARHRHETRIEIRAFGHWIPNTNRTQTCPREQS